MDRLRALGATTLLTATLFVPSAWAQAERGGARPFIGIDLGTARPTNDNYRAHVEPGAVGAPYAGYMFNDYLGIQGQLQFNVHPADDDDRGFSDEEDVTTMFGYLAGPRLDLPFTENLTVYATGQGGGFSGLSGRVEKTSPGFSVGGGLDIYLTRNFAISAFGRWNRAYQAPRPTFLAGQKAGQQGPEDARWATAGIGLKYDFRPEPPPPPAPPPPVAQAPAPPPPPIKRKIVLRSVHFDFDKAAIRADAVPVLNEAVATLKEAGDVSVVVEGHTDSKGTDAYNEALSRRRAQAVRDYLVNHGVSASRLATDAFGESRPVATNETEDGRAQNRRVELRVEN